VPKTLWDSSTENFEIVVYLLQGGEPGVGVHDAPEELPSIVQISMEV
jgi:hypothetical protein